MNYELRHESEEFQSHTTTTVLLEAIDFFLNIGAALVQNILDFVHTLYLYNFLCIVYTKLCSRRMLTRENLNN